jgi:hypothetical protein
MPLMRAAFPDLFFGSPLAAAESIDVFNAR